MRGPTETVNAFFAECGRSHEAMLGAVRRYFTPATVWENVGMATTTGPDEAIALIGDFRESMGMETLRVEMLAGAEQGNKLLTERVDYIVRADGSVAGEIRLMGVLEVRDGHILAWRDYFDTAGLLGRAA